MVDLRNTGIDAVGPTPWGTHFCQFFSAEEDLRELLVPYFRAGLEGGESCLWIASDPADADRAWEALAEGIPDLEAFRRQGRFEILPSSAWYLWDGRFDGDRVIRGWERKLDAALHRGSSGLRIAANPSCLDRSHWKALTEYETAVDGVIRARRILCVCTYSLARCGAPEIADAIKNHRFALLERDERWERIESLERRPLEEALRQSEEALRQAERNKDEFVAMLSHELRNPLAPVVSSLHLLDRTDPADDQAIRALQVIRRQVAQLTRLVDDLLDETRVNRNRISLQRETLELADLVRRAVEDHRPLFARNRVRLEVSLPPEGLHVHGDRVRIAQVVGNLLDNAAKFVPPGGTAWVTLRREPGKTAVLEVADDGVGMTAELLARLFEPFAQADRSPDRPQGGLGLGLHLVKSLVELHGGRIAGHSDGPGLGSRFVVTLPAVDAPDPVDAGPGATAPPPRIPPGDGAGVPAPDGAGGSCAAAGSPRRVLVIDDNVDAAESLRDVLELSGHEVAVAADGPEGIALARKHRPEILLCDLGLPGMDGYEVARSFRADPDLSRTFLVALSGYSRPEDRRRSAEAGFACHLAKPPDLDRIDRLLRDLTA